MYMCTHTCAHLERGKRGASKNCKNLFSFTVCTRYMYQLRNIWWRVFRDEQSRKCMFQNQLIFGISYIRAHVTVILRLLQEYMSDSDQYRMCILVFNPNFFSCLPS